MGELASAYPVAGAMSTWTWKTARGGVGGERIWGWVMGGFVMGYHVGIVSLLQRHHYRSIALDHFPLFFRWLYYPGK
jgi:hypothetical protein